MLFWGVRIAALAFGAWLVWAGWPIFGLFVAITSVGHWLLDVLLNRTEPPAGEAPSDEARALHARAFVADLHADVCLWNRDHLRRNRRGHVDLPRLHEGNVGLQFVTMPTKLALSPRMPRLFLSDIFFWGSVLSLEPPTSWLSTPNRARSQIHRYRRWVANSGGALLELREAGDFAELRQRREKGEKVIGLLLGLEGAHAVRGSIDVPWLVEQGVSVVGLTHFNDNRFADSAHGWRKRGLHDAGRELVRELDRSGITIDLAHASTAAIDDVLAMAESGELKRPLIVSHTGLKGVHDHRRNIADRQAIAIAERGGLIGISFFKPALPRSDLDALGESVSYAIRLLDDAGIDGARHVALGSDFDGAVKTIIDASGWPFITAKLLDVGLSEEQVCAVLGENVMRFFERNLAVNSDY